MIYKTITFNNIKYDLIDTDESTQACEECIFNKKNDCQLMGDNDDCFTYGLNSIWKISISFIRKEKLKKLNENR